MQVYMMQATRFWRRRRIVLTTLATTVDGVMDELHVKTCHDNIARQAGESEDDWFDRSLEASNAFSHTEPALMNVAG